MASSSKASTTWIVAGVAAAAASASLIYYVYHQSNKSSSSSSSSSSKNNKDDSIQTRQLPLSFIPPSTSSGGDSTPTTSNRNTNMSLDDPEEGASDHTPLAGSSASSKIHNANNASNDNNKEERHHLHGKIEELDKKGKALFKNKQYVAAAETFTEALELIGEYDEVTVGTHSLSRQLITLMNNRSAMYEKANMPELALDDCSSILDLEVHHGKARTRKLRILEALQRWYDCLVEICAMQLLFMQANRTNLRMGLPTPPPPVPQSKMEQVLAEVVPEQVEQYAQRLPQDQDARPLPSSYTILQLLKSYTNYNSWMAQAAQDGSVNSMVEPTTTTTTTTSKEDLVAAADRAAFLYKRGRRHVYDGQYAKAIDDFETAYQLIVQHVGAGELMEGDTQARLLEWTGMARHWQYRLDAATECYEKCSALEPENSLLLVKQAGVCMDGSLQTEALVFFDKALQLDPLSADALLHRSNLYMIQAKPDEAKRDLEKCVQHYPNHVMARLRLASILAATQEPDQALQQLQAAERVEPNSSEVQSYRGELYFTQNQMDQARQQFEKAMQLEPNNPTPYVNAAMAILNTPPTQPGQTIDAPGAMALLERALQVDPQFMAAYVQLGQLKLGTATELSKARQVIELYDQALEHCRTTEDLKELCSMRILAVAQVEAATMLKMETFNLQ